MNENTYAAAAVTTGIQCCISIKSVANYKLQLAKVRQYCLPCLTFDWNRFFFHFTTFSLFAFPGRIFFIPPRLLVFTFLFLLELNYRTVHRVPTYNHIANWRVHKWVRYKWLIIILKSRVVHTTLYLDG